MNNTSRKKFGILELIWAFGKYEWKYRNIVFLIFSLVIAYFILLFKPLSSILDDFGSLGYVAAFVYGSLFTYALTTAPVTAALFNLGKFLDPLLIALIGATGAILSDYLIFRFVRNRLLKEIKSLSREIDSVTKPVTNLIPAKQARNLVWLKISRSRYWKYLVPIFAGFIIASPLPDELGVAIFGAAKFEPKRFLMIAYMLNFFGILVITTLARAL